MSGIKQKNSVRARKKYVKRHKRSVLLISAVVLMLLAVVSIRGTSLQAKNKAYQEQEQELRAQLEMEAARTEEIEAFKAYVKTPEYMEEVAKGRLGLIRENEIIFKQQE